MRRAPLPRRSRRARRRGEALQRPLVLFPFTCSSLWSRVERFWWISRRTPGDAPAGGFLGRAGPKRVAATVAPSRRRSRDDAAGLPSSLFPMEDLSAMGAWEMASQLPLLRLETEGGGLSARQLNRRAHHRRRHGGRAETHPRRRRRPGRRGQRSSRRSPRSTCLPVVGVARRLRLVCRMAERGLDLALCLLPWCQPGVASGQTRPGGHPGDGRRGRRASGFEPTDARRRERRATLAILPEAARRR